MAKAPAVIALTIVIIVLVRNYACAGDKPAEGLKIILEQPLVAPGPNIVATSAVLNIPPGDSGAAPHYHSGPTVGYVIEGEFLFQVAGQPPRIIPAGEAFYELDRDIHVWGGNASNTTTCKVVATIYGRPDEAFITFVDNYKRESREEALALARKNTGYGGSNPSKPLNVELKK